MEFIRNLQQLRPQHRGCVATIGNFDGVHRGHQAIIAQLKDHARALNVPATVIIFEPQPQEFFSPDKAPARLTRLREKLNALKNCGVERVLCLHFNPSLANLSAKDFIQQILVTGLGIKHLVVGDDFHFGKARQGNFQQLQAAGAQHGFNVESQHTVIDTGERISSTRIRQALAKGELSQAAHLLGRKYTLYGRVCYGYQRGRTIDFPTANIALNRHHLPLQGVFAVRIHQLGNQVLTGVANIGVRPTIGGTKPLLETHIFDFSDTIYGQFIEVEFVQKLRDEQRFDSFDELKQQIITDAAQARQLFAAEKCI